MAKEHDAKHDAFTNWAEAKGVTINSVAPAHVPGKGFGIVATRNLKRDVTIVSIPSSAFLTHDSDFVRKSGIARATVYGTIAAALTLNHENEERWYKVWQDTWPSREDFETCMPMCWTQAEQDLLPPAAKSSLAKQNNKYNQDVSSVKSKIPANLMRDWYRYYWLIVNTRCFYWIHFKKARDLARRGKKLARDECLTLMPWGDYFNHEDDGCQVIEEQSGATIVTDRSYAKGEEVVISYGAHSNDYLLVEYGFVLSSNKWDNAILDHVIVAMLEPTQAELLQAHGYLGEYYMTTKGFCYRTEVALRAMITKPKQMRQFLVHDYDGESESIQLGNKLEQVCNVLREEIKVALAATKAKKTVTMMTLHTRWQQLLTMCELAEKVGFQ